MTLVAALRSAVATTPLRIAIQSDKGALTYRELLASIQTLGDYLTQTGIGPGVTTGIMVFDAVEYTQALFAASACGATVLPLNPACTREEVRAACSSCSAKCLILCARSARRLDIASLAEELSMACMIVEERVLVGPRLNALGTMVARDVEADAAPAVIVLSSGSTGLSKAVAHTHAKLLSEVAAIRATLGIAPLDRYLCIVPLFHGYGLVSCLLTCLFSCATLVLAGNERLAFALRRREIVEQLLREEITILYGVPFQFKVLASGSERADLSRIRWCISSGGPLDEATFTAFEEKFGVRIRQQYGLSETGTISIEMGDKAPASWASVGTALPGVEVRIERQPNASTDAQGEIVVSVPFLPRDYLPGHAPERNGFLGSRFATGDLGWFDEAGHLYLGGREKLFIDVAGEKVDPCEVEQVLRAHAAVDDAVVVPVSGGAVPQLKAVIVAKSACTAEVLRGYCRARLAPFKVPSVFEFRAELPRSAAGKISRRDLLD